VVYTYSNSLEIPGYGNANIDYMLGKYNVQYTILREAQLQSRGILLARHKFLFLIFNPPILIARLITY
jgi:hypothetical protein